MSDPSFRWRQRARTAYRNQMWVQIPLESVFIVKLALDKRVKV